MLDQRAVTCDLDGLRAQASCAHVESGHLGAQESVSAHVAVAKRLGEQLREPRCHRLLLYEKPHALSTASRNELTGRYCGDSVVHPEANALFLPIETPESRHSARYLMARGEEVWRV